MVFSMNHKRYIFTFLFYLMLEVATEQPEEKGDEIPFTQEDIDIIVSSHNQLRAYNITPSASNMRELTWDDNLAEFSQKWTSNCVYRFKENTTTKLWPAVGQNFFLASAEWTVDFHYSSVLKWLGQKSLFTYENASCPEFCGHYIQLAYGDTYKVGCAASFCPLVTTAGSDKTFDNATFYMCAYLPQAPLETAKKPYKAGPVCSNCSDPTDTCNDLELCSNPSRTKPLPNPPEHGGGLTWPIGWSTLEKAIAGVSGGAAMLGLLGAIFKLCKGTSVGPSSPAAAAAPNSNVTNGKAPTTPTEN